MPDEFNRRDFLKHSAIFGAGVALIGRSPLFAFGPVSANRVGPLTNLALVDDTLHLVAADGGLSPILRESLAFEIDSWDRLPGNAAFFGARMPADADGIVGLFREVKSKWASKDDDDRLELKVALASGWLVQRAGAEAIGPSLEGASDIGAAFAAQDSEVLRSRSAKLDGEASPEELESLFRQMVPRTMTRFHTNIPDYDDPFNWVMRLQEWRTSHTALMARYASAFGDMSSTEYRRYVAEPKFLDLSDAVVAGAESARVSDVPQSDISSLLDGQSQSLYGKGLAEGLRQLLAVSSYLSGSMEEADMSQQLALR